ncbi:FAD-binding oxidoreductase [uncultured Paludibaculum sp.]|uniref:FAD-binding oxidoreductase n=1 Tax=uncultured Paludibaculum sp. TaxID=1765020 RepID=UPI002AAADF5B|nr:FAD-binding oxidoreductase [uncultured Paludibaculum sp.]
MTELSPTTAAELAHSLCEAAGQGQRISLGGARTKDRMAGPAEGSSTRINTTRLNRILQYEPKDLTISVEAGLRYSELTQALAANRQMLPLDPPCAEQATIGGVIASGSSGARRRGYGAARDMVIGLSYATLEGQVVQSGGMVVKNVAGLDVQKTLIGSFGTLAAIVSLNFKLSPLPECTRTFVLSFSTVAEAVAARDQVLRGVLQPAALDLLSARAAERVGLRGYCLLARAGGSENLMARYEKELPGAEALSGSREDALWKTVAEFPSMPRFVIRVSHALMDLRAVLESATGPCLSRAGSGVSYLGFDEAGEVRRWMSAQESHPWARIVEWAPEDEKQQLEQWPAPGPDLALMQRMKLLFDPNQLLNRGRLYGRL